MHKIFSGIVIISLLTFSQAYGEGNKVELPADYKTKFTNYVSSDRIQNADQTIRIFANDIAMQGPGKDGKLPYGSKIVAEVYKAKKDKDGKVMTSILNRRIRGKFALIAVLERKKGFGDGRADGMKTGDWDFGAYKPDGTVAKKDLNSCRTCHAAIGNTNHVFSFEHLSK
jgi:hypothetical protein